MIINYKEGLKRIKIIKPTSLTYKKKLSFPMILNRFIKYYANHLLVLNNFHSISTKTNICFKIC